MLEKESNRKLSGQQMTAATTIGLMSATQQPLSPSRKSRFLEKQVKPFLLEDHPVENHWLFSRVFRDLKKIQKLEKGINSSKKINTKTIDKALSNHLKHEQDRMDFARKYSLNQDSRDVRRKKSKAALSETKLQQEKLLLRSIMDNPQARSKIYENSLLQEYYLKDLEKQKSNISYLNRDFAVTRHRRLTNTPQEGQQLHMKHDQSEVEHVRFLNYVRHEKHVQEAVRRAKRNITYRKELNLERINYIIQCMVLRPLTECPTTDSGEYEKEVTGKLFFRNSNTEGTEGSLYTFMELQQLELLFDRLELKTLPAGFLKETFNRLTKYKTSKVLYYLDFVEVLRKTATQLNIQPKTPTSSGLQEFLERYVKSKPSMYILDAEELCRFFEKDISEFLKKAKIRLCLEAIFRSAAERLEYGRLITLPVLFDTLASYKLLQSIQRDKIVVKFRYLALYQEGLDLEAFVLMTCMIAMSDELQLFRAKTQHRRKIIQALMAKPNGAEVLIGHLRHYFIDRLKIFQRVLCDQ